MAVGAVNFLGFVGDVAHLLGQAASTAFRFVRGAILDAPRSLNRDGAELRGLHSQTSISNNVTRSRANADPGRALAQAMHSSAASTANQELRFT